MAGAFLWDDRVAQAIALTSVGATPVASLPMANLLDPQPRHRARWLGGSASILVDFGTDTIIDAAALISTNLPETTTVRWRVGLAAESLSPGLGTDGLTFDTGVVDAATGEDAGGNVVLIMSPAVGRYLQVDVAAPGIGSIDIGRLVAGPLWRLAHGPAYGLQEGRAVLDRRDRNALTGAEFPVPALANPRVVRFSLPLLTTAEVRGEHRRMLRALGAAGEALWVPDVGLAQAELNARAVWGAVAVSGEDAAATRDSAAAWSRSFRVIERV
jgi:hypothetical protein